MDMTAVSVKDVVTTNVTQPMDYEDALPGGTITIPAGFRAEVTCDFGLQRCIWPKKPPAEIKAELKAITEAAIPPTPTWKETFHDEVFPALVIVWGVFVVLFLAHWFIRFAVHCEVKDILKEVLTELAEEEPKE